MVAAAPGKIQNTQEIKRTLFNRTKHEKKKKKSVQIFEEVLFFKLRTTEKQTIQLILYQLDVGGWRKEKGTRLTKNCELYFFG